MPTFLHTSPARVTFSSPSPAQVLCKSQQLEYATEVGKDNRISIVLESATPIAGGAPSFAQLQARSLPRQARWSVG